jgi:hypothetical protein
MVLCHRTGSLALQRYETTASSLSCRIRIPAAALSDFAVLV